MQRRVRLVNGKWQHIDVPENVWEATQLVDAWMETNKVIHLGPLRRYPPHQ